MKNPFDLFLSGTGFICFMALFSHLSECHSPLYTFVCISEYCVILFSLPII